MPYEKKYCALILLRLSLVLMPQNGYIHPDEFFQGPEVVSGEVFDLKVKTPWEFETSQPIRSMAVLSITTRLPILLYKWFLQAAGLQPDAFSLLLMPRLFQTVLHASCDLVVFMLCQQIGLDPWRGLFYYALSYTTLVLGTRTLANSVESALLALLVCTVLTNSRLLNKPTENHLLLFYVNVIQGLLFVLGVFHRPTFVVFAAAVMVYDLYQCHMSGTLSSQMSAKSLGALYSSVTCILLDSCYYRPDYVHHLLQRVTTQENVLTFTGFWELLFSVYKLSVITPVNFLTYNTNEKNLSSHGIHPWYTHLLASLPGLLGPAALVLLFPLLARRNSCRGWPLLSYVTVVLPVLVFSLVPHQEARFLLPVCPFAIVLVFLLMTHRWPHRFGVALLLWGLFNLAAVIFWGFLHQGGLLPMMQHLSEVLRTERGDRCHSIIFYHTYMPPQHLLLLPRNPHLLSESAPCLHVEDLAGNPPAALTAVTEALHARLRATKLPGNASVHVVFPSTVAKQVRTAINKQHFHLRYMARVNGHVSGEDPPSWGGSIWNYLDQMSIMDYEFHAILS